jgi:6-phosphogluconolactonase
MLGLTMAASLLTRHSVAAAAERCLVYVGTYTGPQSKGIHAYRLELASGRCEPIGLVAEVKSPSFLAVHPGRKFLYSVNEIQDFDGKPTGGVSAFAIHADSGKLDFLNHQSSQGAGPCHLVVDRTGQTLLVANYGSGSVAALPVAPDGRLSPATSVVQHAGGSVNPQRQTGPHAHSINVDLGNRFAVAADLGLDKLLVYRLDPARSQLMPNDPPFATVAPGSGPRHFAFHPNGKFAYVINEILCTITCLAYYGQQGRLSELQTLTTLPSGVERKSEFSTAEVQVHPSGKYVYGSNRGHDSITTFAVDDATGTLRYVDNRSTEGRTPRGFGVDPTGQFLLAGNQDSHSIVVFRVDPTTGQLSPTGQTLQVGSPVCVKFVIP